MEVNLREAGITAIFDKGLLAHNTGDLSVAEQFYKEALAIQPHHPEANHNIGVVLVAKNQLNKALQFFKHALDNSPNVSLFWASYIDVLIKLDRIGESKTLIKAVKDAGISCDKIEALSHRLDIEHQDPGPKEFEDLNELVEQQKFDDAIQLCQSLMEAYPSSAILHITLGKCHFELGHIKPAIDSYQKAIGIKPELAVGFIMLGQIHSAQGNPDQAIENLEKAIEIEPNNHELYSTLGVVLLQKGDVDEAITYLEQALKQNPNSSSVLSMMGDAYNKLGDHNLAINYLERAVSLDPDNAAAHFNLGNAQHDVENFETAISALKRSLALQLRENALLFNPRFLDTKIDRKQFQNGKKASQLFQYFPDTEVEFFSIIIHEVIEALGSETLFDNFDKRRFNIGGADHSKDWLYPEYLFFFNWLKKNITNLFTVFSSLNDDRSKQLFLYLLAFRLGSHFSVRLPLSSKKKNGESSFLQSLNYTKSKLQTDGAFGKLKHYDFTFNNRRYCVDCLGLEDTLHWGQYFLNRDSVSVRPELGDHVIDGGACLGDTVAVFSNAVGEGGLVYSFDPLEAHLEILEKNISQFPINNVKTMPFGLGDSDIYAKPIKTNGYNPGFNIDHSIPTNNQETLMVPIRKIDTLLENGTISKIDFIKLDIEGFEMRALLGAKKAIDKCKPKMAISIYHKPDDMFDLMQYVKKTHNFYNFYIGHYTIHREETVLYCDPKVPK